MKLLISLPALLLSIILVQMGIGSLRSINAISGQALGFTPIKIGIIASGHFAGFSMSGFYTLIESWLHRQKQPMKSADGCSAFIALSIYRASYWQMR